MMSFSVMPTMPSHQCDITSKTTCANCLKFIDNEGFGYFCELTKNCICSKGCLIDYYCAYQDHMDEYVRFVI